MPRFRYRTFLWIFGISNSVVWFFLLFALGHLVFEHFADDTGLGLDAAWAFFALTPFVSSVLAAQGAIVNLRAQYLIGRFDLPSRGKPAPVEPSNPWLAAVSWAVPVAAGAAVLTTVATRLMPPMILDASTTAIVMGGIGAAITSILVLTLADREFRRYQFHLGDLKRRSPSTAGYMWSHLALPWGLVNGVLNGVIAWMVYHQGPGHSAPIVSLEELRLDLTVTTLLICVFTALATFPEVETDFAAGLTPQAGHLAAMPRLVTRFAVAFGLAASVWLTFMLVERLAGIANVSIESTVIMKAFWGGTLAALAASRCGRWTLARCIGTTTTSHEMAARRRIAV